MQYKKTTFRKLMRSSEILEFEAWQEKMMNEKSLLLAYYFKCRADKVLRKAEKRMERDRLGLYHNAKTLYQSLRLEEKVKYDRYKRKMVKSNSYIGIYFHRCRATRILTRAKRRLASSTKKRESKQ